MIFGKKKDKPLPESNFYINFKLVDSKLTIDMDWPENGDFNMFLGLLKAINSGDLVHPILASIHEYGEKNNQMDKAELAHKVLDKIAKNKAEDDDKPMILPSQVINLQMKAFGK